MEDGKIFVVLALVIGVFYFTNRKRIHKIFEKKISAFDKDQDKNFLAAVGTRMKSKNMKSTFAIQNA